MDSVAYLIQQSHKKDSMGQKISGGETLLEVFVTEQSITRAEFFGAGQNGLKPDYVLKTPKINYSGEEEIVYNEKRYTVYRAFVAPESDEVELYIHRKGGVKNG